MNAKTENNAIDECGDEFYDRIFPAEIEEIGMRRRALGLDADKLDSKPSADNGLHGLALSGGGIRSGTFSLGVIQALAKHSILKRVDYLSTVSGGGYIGSTVSALLNDPDNRPDDETFPLKYTAGAEEPPALTHLRNSSNFLTPSGLLNMLRLPNLLLRGIIMMLFVFLPFIMLAVFVTEVAYEVGPHWDNLPKQIPYLIGLFLLLAIAFPFLVRLMRGLFDWRRRNAFELLLTIPLLVAGALLVLVPILYVTRNAIEHNAEQLVAALKAIGWQGVWLTSAVILAVLVLFMLAGKASENVARLRGKILLALVGLLGPAILFFIFLLLCLWKIDSPFIPADSAKILNAAVACDEPCISADPETDIPAERKRQFGLVTLADSPDGELTHEDSRAAPFEILRALFQEDPAPTNFRELNHALYGRNIEFYPDATVSCSVVPPSDSELVLEMSGKSTGNPCSIEPANWKKDHRVWLVVDNYGKDESKRNLCPTTPDSSLKYRLSRLNEKQLWIKKNCTYFTRASARSLRIEGAQLGLFTNNRDRWFVGIFIALFLFNRFFLDINITSPHGFYRDRLSKAFLFKITDDNKVEQEDDLKLSELNAPDTAAPYHLVNVALNLQGSVDPCLRGRMSDFFIFSKHFSGSQHTGYVPTLELEKYDKHLDLATAIAISGAAAAPNMGTTTSRALTFVMTLLNIRLGYWLPNPRWIKRKHWRKRFDLSGARPTLVWKEALGLLDAKGSHVNVSDGGHIENLAIYPLLKRRCKYIIAVDGEADPDMSFGGLVTLMRLARIDMGIEFDMKLDGLRKKETNYSESHWTQGTIRYPDGQTGHLLYIKLSVSGDEPEYIRAYRGKHADYPHQSTADQFFTEEQFEAYRALGEHIAEGLLGDIEKQGGLGSMQQS